MYMKVIKENMYTVWEIQYTLPSFEHEQDQHGNYRFKRTLFICVFVNFRQVFQVLILS